MGNKAAALDLALMGVEAALEEMPDDEEEWIRCFKRVRAALHVETEIEPRFSRPLWPRDQAD